MSRGSGPLSSLLLAAALASSLAGIGCAEHHSYRVYDPYYTDYHTWNNDEVVYTTNGLERLTAIRTVTSATSQRKIKKNTGRGATTMGIATTTTITTITEI